MKTLRQIYSENFADIGAALDESRKEIRFKRILFIEKEDGCCVAMPCSRVKDQATLDDINNRYGVTVHFGTAKSYEYPELDISKCRSVNNSKDGNAKKCYLSCDSLSLEDAIELYRKLADDYQKRGKIAWFVRV